MLLLLLRLYVMTPTVAHWGKKTIRFGTDLKRKTLKRRNWNRNLWCTNFKLYPEFAAQSTLFLGKCSCEAMTNWSKMRHDPKTFPLIIISKMNFIECFESKISKKKHKRKTERLTSDFENKKSLTVYRVESSRFITAKWMYNRYGG